jgi:hypothetical protein
VVVVVALVVVVEGHALVVVVSHAAARELSRIQNISARTNHLATFNPLAILEYYIVFYA